MTGIAPRIVADEGIRFGKPVIKGTRVPVDLVVGKLAGGMTVEQVAEEYELEREDVLTALAYAAEAVAAVSHDRVLTAADVDFANLRAFPLGSHHGILVARLPNEVPVARLNAVILDAIRALSDDESRGSLAIVEPSRIRLRRPH